MIAYCDREHPGSDAEARRWCEMYHRPLLPAVHCSFCDEYAVGHVASPAGPWSYCADHQTDARTEARS